MNQLIDKIRALETQSEALEPTGNERDKLIEKVHRFASKFIDKLPDYNAFAQYPVSADAFAMDLGKQHIGDLLDVFDKEIIHNGIKPASGGHVGYIPGGGLFTSALGDYLSAISNEYAGMHFASPGAVAMENELIDWMKSLFGFPDSAIGNLTSGGSIANMIALTAARDKFGVKNEKIVNSVIYVSPQVHHCVLKALRIIGLEDVRVHHLKLDAQFRIDTAYLKEKIAEDKKDDLQPFLVIASAGTTDSGAIDPLKAIGEVCKAENLWYHIDGAYGGFFMLIPEKKHLFEGIELADSLVIDPHKGLFLPYGLGAVLVKDKEAVFHSHHYTANYMQDAINDSIINPADVSPELTKHYRGLRMWFPLKLHGLEPFVACLREKILLTQYFREQLEVRGFKLGPEPDLTVSYFWYPSEEIAVNTFNEKLLALIHEDGQVFLSSTKLGNAFVIRMAIGSFRTKLATIDAALKMIDKCMEQTRHYFSGV